MGGAGGGAASMRALPPGANNDTARLYSPLRPVAIAAMQGRSSALHLPVLGYTCKQVPVVICSIQYEWLALHGRAGHTITMGRARASTPRFWCKLLGGAWGAGAQLDSRTVAPHDVLVCQRLKPHATPLGTSQTGRADDDIVPLPAH